MTLNCKKVLHESIKNTKLLAVSSLLFWAGEGYAQQQVVQLPEKEITLKEVFKQIEKQTQLSVDYNHSKVSELMDKKVVLSDGDVNSVLEKALAGTGLTYSFEGDHIIISVAQAQTPSSGKKKTVSGTVVDTKGEPIIGATIQEKGTTNGIVTDFDGNFTLTVAEGAMLSVAYLGYQTQELAAKGTDLKIKLKEDTEVLDEVVVIGYGTTSAKKMVSAVTAVKGEKLQDLPFANVASTLQGRASGVVIKNEGGEPGSNPKVSIRGGGDPLYVIDGVICEAWDFQTLNPNDIESLSVLKDAAALAVYGSRAADGIVMVKTKEGQKGKRSITYTFNAQYSQPTVLPEKMNAIEYAELQNWAAWNDGQGEYAQFSPEELEIIRNQTDPLKYPDTDWYSLGLKNFAPEYRHSLSITGNQKDVNYYLSLGMFDQGSLYTSDALNYSRYNLRSNVNTTFEEIGLKVAANINAAYEKKKYPSFSATDIWGHLQNRTPLEAGYNADGTLSTVSDNPMMEMDERSGYDKNDGLFMNAQFVADWALPWVKGLSLGAMFNYRLNASHVKKMQARAPQYNQDGTLLEVEKPNLREEAYFGDSYNLELNASYLRTFADVHSIDAKFVLTMAENNGYDFWAARRDYLSASVDQMFAGSSASMTNGGNAKEGGRIGLVGRVKYDYASRYYIEGSFRYDGSDNFAPGHRWGFFPSGAVAWDITEEPFFKNLNLKDVNLLKLRASYGVIGTESGVNRFGYLSVYNMVENAACIGGELVPGFNEGNLVNPDLLSWFTRRSLDYGLDMAFFNNRLKSSVDYFFYVTKGGLVSPKNRYTTPLGAALPMIKSDTEQRREGFEFSMSWAEELPSGFYYSVGTNMTYYNNLYVRKDDETLSSLMNPYQRNVHQTDYYELVYIDNGLYQTPGQVIGYPRRLASTETKLGDIAYQDINGDGKIDGEDQIRYGMPDAPHFTYGIDFLFSYKGLSLSGLLYGTGKRHMEFADHVKGTESAHLVNKYQLDYWRADNTDAEFPRVSRNARVNADNNNQNSTFWIRNASFLRLKNLTLEYDFKYKLLKNVKWLNLCKVNLTGTNLFTISGIKDYWDPEAGVNGTGYPVQRVYSLGVTVGF